MRKVLTIALSLLILTGPAWGEPLKLGAIEIDAPFSRATLPKAPTGGAYFTVINTGTTDDRLVSATSPVAGEVQMHEMKIENSVASMRELPDGIVIPAGATVVLTPSGTHLMLTHLTHPLVQGGSLPLTLNFEQAGSITLDVPIGSIAQREAP